MRILQPRSVTLTRLAFLTSFDKRLNNKQSVFDKRPIIVKRAYDRNFPRDQLFCVIGKLRCNESSFFGHIIVTCLLWLLRKLNQTESQTNSADLENLSKNSSMSKFYGTNERIHEIKRSWLGSSQDSKHKMFVLLQNRWSLGKFLS